MYYKRSIHTIGYYFVLMMTLLLAWMLSIWALPTAVHFVWPCWPLLWLCCVMTYSEGGQVPSLWVWIAGLVMDQLTGSLLGLHVLLYLFVYYGLLARGWKVYLLSIPSRPLFVLLILLLVITSEQVALNGWGDTYYGLMPLVQSLSTFVLWFLLSQWFDTRLARSQYLSSFEIT